MIEESFWNEFSVCSLIFFNMLWSKMQIWNAQISLKFCNYEITCYVLPPAASTLTYFDESSPINHIWLKQY